MNKSLGIVCCYFNPCNYISKYDNFIEFYDKLSSYAQNICVVELIHPDSQYTLPQSVHSVKFHSETILWHKENLLNQGIKKLLLDGFTKIAWLDADIIFDDSYWIDDAIKLLDQYKLCQLFSRAENKNTFYNGCVREWKDVGSILPINSAYHTGYGWAATSEVLSSCMLYDKSILGGGDSLIWLASFSHLYNFNEIIKHHPIQKLNLKHFFKNYLSWANKWGSLIQGSVGHVYCPIKVLPHGHTKDRNYLLRYQFLIDSNYNPYQDIEYENNIITTNNHMLLILSKKYFSSRNEDQKNNKKFNSIIKYIKSKLNLLKLEIKFRDQH